MCQVSVDTYEDKVDIDLLVPPFNHVVAVRFDCIGHVGPSLRFLFLGTDILTLL